MTGELNWCQLESTTTPGTCPAPGSSGSVISERFAPPLVPHADDLEFDTGTFPFTIHDSTGALVAGQPSGTFNPYTDDIVNHRVVVNPDVKRSWLRVQTRNNNGRFYYLRPHVFPANQLIWTRLGIRTQDSPTDDEVDVGLVLMASAAGVPDPNNRIEFLWIHTLALGRKWVCRSVAAGVPTDGWNPAFGSTLVVTMPPYFMIHKRAGVYHFWAGFDGGGIAGPGVQLANAFTPAFVGFMGISNGTQPGAGSGWWEADFLRFIDTDTQIP